MKVVVDASAAVLIALEYAESVLNQATWVLVPDVFFAEVTNALWKQHTFADTSVEACESALSICLSIPNQVVPTSELCQEAFQLARTNRHPAYDMFYLALAHREGATLFTKDKNLRKLARRYGLAVA
jgi:predicted nucleic acid-binding protein